MRRKVLQCDACFDDRPGYPTVQKAPGAGAMLCFISHSLTKSRSSLIMQVDLTRAVGQAERRAARGMLHRHSLESTKRLTKATCNSTRLPKLLGARAGRRHDNRSLNGKPSPNCGSNGTIQTQTFSSSLLKSTTTSKVLLIYHPSFNIFYNFTSKFLP